MQSGFETNAENNKKEAIAKIKQEIEFNLAVSVDDELASFIADFITENNENVNNEPVILSQQLQSDGVYFLQSMKEMFESTNTQPNAYSNEEPNSTLYDENSGSDEEWNVKSTKRKPKIKSKKQNAVGINADGSKRCGRLLLNDALKNVGNFEGWSDARIKAWKNRKTSPNAYFYRFNVPGQPQKNGQWSKQENKLFMQRVLELGVNDKWGIFSKVIPGRVGYVCSNKWTKMQKDGDVKDLNRYKNAEGKLKFHRNSKTAKISDEFKKYAFSVIRDPTGTFKDLPARHPYHPSDAYCEDLLDDLKANVSGNAKGGKKRKRDGDNDNDDEDFTVQKKKKRKRAKKKKEYDSDDDGAFHCKVNVDVSSADLDNPMPDFKDIITGDCVVKPTMSPYGHVLSYDTWTKILRTAKTKNTCPFTCQKLTRRSLIKLTLENYDEYKDQIKGISEEEMATFGAMTA